MKISKVKHPKLAKGAIKARLRSEIEDEAMQAENHMSLQQVMDKRMAKGGEIAEQNMEVKPDKGFGKIIILGKDEDKKKMAEGGSIEREMDMQPEEEAEEERESSIVAAIMAKRRKEQENSDSDIDMMLAEGGQVDIDENNDEESNQFDELSEAALKENYDEDFESMSQPNDSNLIGDEREKDESDKHDMVSQIRRKMKK